MHNFYISRIAAAITGAFGIAAFGLAAMLLPGCSDSTVTPPNSTAGAKSGHGAAFDLRVPGATWGAVTLKITMTLEPYESFGMGDSRETIGDYTGGKVIIAYRNSTGARIKKMARVSVDNRTRAMTLDGRAVSTLGELFPAIAGEIGANDTVEICVYFERYVGIAVDPAYSLREVAALNSFAAIEPAALDSVKPPAKCYVTDKGTKVPYTEDPYPDRPDLTEQEACDFLKTQNLKDSVEVKSGPTDTTNCHGWTFTCGKDWISDPSDILKDNGYREVPKDSVKAGDIVVYKKDGQITHTGIVRIKDGKIVIDSKWGCLGRYCHSPENVLPIYGTPCYQRTDRPAPPGSTDPDKDKHTIKTK